MIHMLADYNVAKYYVGNADILSEIDNVPTLPIFSDEVFGFLTDLSATLIKKPESKKYSDVVAFAFWIRKGILERERQMYMARDRYGLGLVFHITPSNIPVQFAVSLTYALLAGNASVVRVSQKDFPQISVICGCINELLNGPYKNLKNYICVVSYSYDSCITAKMSLLCDARLIWGGDSTIAEIRKNAIPPRTRDLGFSDRTSIAIIDADAYLKKDIDVIANDFYLDTYFVDQNACSSPKIIVWIGDSILEAKNVFWQSVQNKVEAEYEMAPIKAIDKLVMADLLAANKNKVISKSINNLLVRLEIAELSEDVLEYKESCGFFLEYSAQSLDDILPLLNKKCQTITYVGDIKNDIYNVIKQNGVKGCDRIVPMGHSLDLSLCWDGYDMIESLSRVISII